MVKLINRGRGVGFLHEAGIGHRGKAKVIQVTSPENSQGVYKAKVEIFNSNTGQWIPKGAESTFSLSHGANKRF